MLRDGTPTYFKPATREKTLVRPVAMEFPDEAPPLPEPVDPQALIEEKQAKQTEQQVKAVSAAEAAAAVSGDNSSNSASGNDDDSDGAERERSDTSGTSDDERHSASSRSSRGSQQHDDTDAAAAPPLPPPSNEGDEASTDDTDTDELVERALASRSDSFATRTSPNSGGGGGGGGGSRRASRRARDHDDGVQRVHSRDSNARLRRRHTHQGGSRRANARGEAAAPAGGAAFHSRMAALDGDAADNGERPEPSSDSRRRRGAARAAPKSSFGMSSRTRVRQLVSSATGDDDGADGTQPPQRSSSAGILGYYIDEVTRAQADQRRRESSRSNRCPECRTLHFA